MKKLLAWDTSSKTGTVVAAEWSEEANWEKVRLVTELVFNVESTTHSERLLWGIHQVLEAARWKIQEVDFLGVGVGPGSFTGLRIGVTTARTLAHTLGKPLVPVSSLAVLAGPAARLYAMPEIPFRTLVVAVTDACKGELFARWGEAKNLLGSTGRGVFEEVIEPAELISKLKKKLTVSKKTGSSLKWVVVGEGRNRYLDQWQLLPNKSRIQSHLPFSDLIQGTELARRVWEGIQENKSCDPLDVKPEYLRASDAEIKLQKGLLPRILEFEG